MPRKIEPRSIHVYLSNLGESLYLFVFVCTKNHLSETDKCNFECWSFKNYKFSNKHALSVLQ